MASKREEIKAFQKLLKEKIPGTEHKDRVCTITYASYTLPGLEYGAYISGFDKLYGFYGWAYASTPMEAVDNCIAKAKEVIALIKESEAITTSTN